MKKKALFIGGTGTISTGITRQLARSEEWELTLLNRGTRSEAVPDGVKVIQADITDEVAVAAAILKKQRCRSRKRIQNTIKSMNPKMSMDAARALLEQMEARGFVLIDAQGHATFT